MTERNEPVDRRHEEALSAALHEHARTVRPAGDGLVRIRSRVQRRGRRVRFLAPLASVAAATAAVTAIVASGLLTTSHPQRSLQADGSTPPPKAPTTTTRPPVLATNSGLSNAPSPSVAPASSVAPSVTTSATLVTTAPTTTSLVATTPNGINPPVWPFADAAAATTWQQSSSQKTSEAWHLDPRSVAERFVSTLELALGLPHFAPGGTAPVRHDDGTATVDVTRTGLNGSTLVLGTVTLSQWTTGADAPWGVVSVTSPAASTFPLSIKAPLPGTAVTSPLSVSIGMVGGAEDDVYTSAWSAGASSPSAKSHDVMAADKIETLASGIPTSGTGFVAVLDGSSGAGAFGLSRLAVTAVRYGTVVPADSYVAVVSGELQVLSSRTNARIRTLAGGAPGIGQVAVSADRQWVYYLQASGSCGGQVWKTRLDGSGSPVPETHWLDQLSAFAIAGETSQWLDYVYTPCTSGGQTLFWSVGGDQVEPPTISSSSRPPDLKSIAVAPDGSQASGVVRTGMEGNVFTYLRADSSPGGGAARPSSPPARSLADGTIPAACRTAGQGCVGVTYAPNGDLILARSEGDHLTVVREHDGTDTVLFTVKGTTSEAGVDTDPSGSQVLLTDGQGHGWSWPGRGAAVALPSGATDASW